MSVCVWGGYVRDSQQSRVRFRADCTSKTSVIAMHGNDMSGNILGFLASIDELSIFGVLCV